MERQIIQTRQTKYHEVLKNNISGSIIEEVGSTGEYKKPIAEMADQGQAKPNVEIDRSSSTFQATDEATTKKRGFTST